MSMNEMTLLIVNILLLILAWRSVARCRRERFRYRIRLIRDDLFDFMWQNGHNFDTPAYREARQILNGILQMSNFMTPCRFLVMMSCWPHQHRPLMVESLENEALREKIDSVYRKASQEWMRSLFLSGAFGMVIRAVVAILKVAALTRHVACIQSKIEKGKAESLSAAYGYRTPSLCR